MDVDEIKDEDEELAGGEVSLDALRDEELDADELADLDGDDDEIFGVDEVDTI